MTMLPAAADIQTRLLHRRSQDLGGGGTRPMPPSHASGAHTFEAVAGRWESVSALAVNRAKKNSKKIYMK